jgi:predicted DNA-binding WGR domain protein
MPPKKRAAPSGPSYAGEVFCFTGFRDKDLGDAVVAAGGSVAASMTKAVTCVVCKNGSESTKKVQDAVAKGLKLMTKTELEDELQGNGSTTAAAAAPAPKKGRTAAAAPAPKQSAQAAKSAAIVAAAASARNITKQVGCVDPIADALFDVGTEVAMDGAEIFDVALSQIDLSKNIDKYYIIQLLVTPPKKKYQNETYSVFTRWGRTGNAGQNQTSGPYDDIEDAVTEFKQKFHDKTQNDWDNRHSFKVKKNHYNLLRVDHASKAARKVAASGGQLPKWEYYVDDHVDGKVTGWYPYTADGAEAAEDLWVTFQANNQMSTRIVESGTYNYSVDLVNMTQTNVDHPGRKMRHIRRSFMGNVTQGANVGVSSASSMAVAAPVAAAASVVTATVAVTASAVSSFKAMSSAAATAMASALTVAAPKQIAAASGPLLRPVDSLCPLAKLSTVRVVEEYDLMLNQADIRKNANKFYRLQVKTAMKSSMISS